jgi:glycosyltransferase involved in cell wall biosynthesis
VWGSGANYLVNQVMAVLYVSFDILLHPKGASVHISAFCQAIASVYAPLHLVTVADSDTAPPMQIIDDRLYHSQLPARGKNLIERVLSFRKELAMWMNDRYFEVIHFRSIFEGFWLVRDRDRYAKHFIYEVNGLPSIELKYRYPAVMDDPDLLRKLRAQEDYCLQRSDRLITPSPITANYLISRGGDPQRIHVIPNGVDTSLFTPAISPIPKVTDGGVRVVYFGTLSPWQGWELSVRAIAQLPPQFHLCLIAQGSKSQVQAVQRLIRKLGVSNRCQLLPAMAQAELVPHLQQADLITAPLTLCDRNVVQGCCPLKILEGMAVGVPVITSDLPVVRCLGHDREHFLLVKPNSVDEITGAVEELYRDRVLCQKIRHQARSHIIKYYSWQRAGQELLEVYSFCTYKIR